MLPTGQKSERVKSRERERKKILFKKKNEEIINLFFDFKNFKKKIAIHENCAYPRGRISKKSERSAVCA